MNPVVEKNLEKMLGADEGDMISLIMSESIGREVWKKYPCAGANFSYDPETGEIKYFECFQYLPLEYAKLPRSFFKLAINFQGKERFRIVGLEWPPELSKAAEKNLEQTVIVYNEKYAFPLNQY
ncbi:hypothetical protein KY348_05950 [Candidatus Woesearchaeota archaeon]|nr:hypothetical protein [Candidatus Woesearchaeota archaeon]